MIEIERLSKRLGGTLALDGIDLRLGDGRVALLGRNGAGKSTLLRILCGLWVPTSGSVRIDGLAPRKHRVEVLQRIGFMPEWPDLHPSLTARALLEFGAAARSTPAADLHDRVARFGIGEILDVPAGELSHGQKRAVTLAAATLHAPPILLLDEPTNGLDPVRVAALRDYLASPLAPRLLLVSTHQLDFVVTIAERFVVLKEGRVAADGDLQHLRKVTGSESLEKSVLRLLDS